MTSASGTDRLNFDSSLGSPVSSLCGRPPALLSDLSSCVESDFLMSFCLESGFASPDLDPVRVCVASLGLDGTVEVRLALEDVGAVALLNGRLPVKVVDVVPGLGRSRVDALGGLRVKEDGFFGGMPVLSAGLVDVAVRVFSGDFGPSAELGLDDGVEPRAGGFSTGAIICHVSQL